MTDCKHVIRVRTGTGQYLCLMCGEQWHSSGLKAPQAPEGWRERDLADLRVWYARNVLKALI